MEWKNLKTTNYDQDNESISENSFYGEFGKTYRYELTKDIDLTLSGFRTKYYYKDAAEVELYKNSTLVDYIQWAKQTAPAQNYICNDSSWELFWLDDHEE